MPGFEIFNNEEKKEVQDVLDNGVLMRYGFDGMRNGHHKVATLERDLASKMQTKHARTHVVVTIQPKHTRTHAHTPGGTPCRAPSRFRD